MDERRGQGIYLSDDLINWEWNGLILDQSRTREDDGKIGLHADVVCSEEAYIFYFTCPERKTGNEPSSFPPYR